MNDRPDAGAADRAKRWAQKAAVVAFIVILAPLLVAGILAALGLLGRGYSQDVLSIVFWFGCFGAFVNTAGTLARAGIPEEDRKVSGGYGDMPPTLNLIKNILWMALPVALFGGGHYDLGALFAYIVVLQIAARAEDRRILGEQQKAAAISRAIRRVVFAAAEVLARVVAPIGRVAMRPVWDGMPLIGLFLLPILLPLVVIFAIPFLLYSVVRNRQVTKRLVRDARAEGKVVWFAYSEPHQREHFLGESGVLNPAAARVMVRDWRADLGELRTMYDGSVRKTSYETDEMPIDATFLQRFRLTNMKDDLPFIAVLGRSGKIHPFYCNGPYRRRHRDGGVSLTRIENEIQSALEKSIFTEK